MVGSDGLGGGGGEIAGEFGFFEFGGGKAADLHTGTEVIEFFLCGEELHVGDFGGIAGEVGGGDVAGGFGAEVVERADATDFLLGFGDFEFFLGVVEFDLERGVGGGGWIARNRRESRRCWSWANSVASWG